MIRFRSLLIAATLLTLSSATTADYVYKCQSAEGRKVFSGFPCGPNAVKEEYKNLAPARKVDENLPPRQGELLNKPLADRKMKASTTETETNQSN